MPGSIPNEAGGCENTGSSTVSVKVPNFWPNNTKLYFVQLEASFRLAKTVGQSKFDHFVASLACRNIIVCFRHCLYTFRGTVQCS